MSPLRVKFGLLIVASVLTTMLVWNSAQGQMRPRGPRMNPPGGGDDMGINWRCPKCGRTGPGMVPPETCPGCGVRFINGIGNGSAGMFGDRGGPPMNNPGLNPPSRNLDPGFVPNPDSSSQQTSSSTRNTLLIVFGIGLILVGAVVLTGGAFLVFHSMRSSNSSGARRRPRREEFDD